MLTPRAVESDVLELFEAAGANVRRGAELIREMLADFPERSHLAAEILACEHEGDRLVRDILRLVAAGPDAGLDPLDAQGLATALDDVIDHTEEAADRLVLYGIEAPMEQAERMARILVAAACRVATALEQLRAGVDVRAELAEVHRLEHEGDRVLRAATASLFGQGIDPMIVIRWKDVFDSLEEAIDACRTVAHRLEGIALKRTG